MGEYRFEVYKDENNEWRWRFKSANNEIMASGEAYETKQGAKQCIATLRMFMQSAIVEETDD